MQKSRYLILGKEEVSKYILKVNINIILNNNSVLEYMFVFIILILYQVISNLKKKKLTNIIKVKRENYYNVLFNIDISSRLSYLSFSLLSAKLHFGRESVANCELLLSLLRPLKNLFLGCDRSIFVYCYLKVTLNT